MTESGRGAFETHRPARRLRGRVAELLRTAGDGFETRPCDGLDLTFAGIEGDRHGGQTRRSGGREPWYRRGTVIRNERQLSLVSREELDEIAARLAIERLEAGWIGANLVIEGIARLTALPPRTTLFFEGGATLRVDGDNHPCRASGRAIARHVPGRPEIETRFSSRARGLRGLVAWVEKPGRVAAGEGFEARIPAQHLY